MLRFAIVALMCASLLYAVDPEDHVRKSVPVGSATRLVLSVDVGSVQVEPGSGQSVDVDVYFHGIPSSQELDRLRRDYRLDVSEQGSDIYVDGGFRNGSEPMFGFWRLLFGWPREVEYRVTVPQKFSAAVKTSGGPITVRDLQGTVAAHTSGGPIRVEGVTGDVDVSTSGGPISLERDSGRVRAHTSGGGIMIRDLTGSVDASTSGGGVVASLAGQPKQDCRLYTSGGGISVTLRKDIRVDLDASTSGGNVSTDFPVPIRDGHHWGELHAPINGGGPQLYLHTSGGSISVHQAD